MYHARRPSIFIFDYSYLYSYSIDCYIKKGLMTNHRAAHEIQVKGWAHVCDAIMLPNKLVHVHRRNFLLIRVPQTKKLV